MKAKKVSVIVRVKTLSLDSIPAMLMKVSENINRESAAGMIRMDDGDQVKWKTKQRSVKF